SPGKKLWTWGNGDFGKAWERNLTDSNGPYIELMAGVYTDNQPDFAWIMPYEEKSFTQYFLPYRELGMIDCANKDILLHFSVADNRALVKVFATSPMPQVRISIYRGSALLTEYSADISPEKWSDT